MNPTLSPAQVEQRRAARPNANRYRSAVAEERRRLAGLSMGDASNALAELVETETDPAILSGRVLHFVRAIPYRGRVGAERITKRAGLRDAGVRLRDLTENERAALAAELRRAA